MIQSTRPGSIQLAKRRAEYLLSTSRGSNVRCVVNLQHKKGDNWTKDRARGIDHTASAVNLAPPNLEGGKPRHFPWDDMTWEDSNGSVLWKPLCHCAADYLVSLVNLQSRPRRFDPLRGGGPLYYSELPDPGSHYARHAAIRNQHPSLFPSSDYVGALGRYHTTVTYQPSAVDMGFRGVFPSPCSYHFGRDPQLEQGEWSGGLYCNESQ